RVPHQIVAVQGDVERAGRDVVIVDVLHRAGQPAGERHAARADADQRELLDTAIALDDFVRDPGQRTPHAIRVHHHGHGDTAEKALTQRTRPPSRPNPLFELRRGLAGAPRAKADTATVARRSFSEGRRMQYVSSVVGLVLERSSGRITSSSRSRWSAIKEPATDYSIRPPPRT